MNLSVPTTASLTAAGNRAGSIKGHIFGTLASQVWVFGFGLITSVLLNRTLGPEGKGIYAMVMTLSQLVALCASLGLAKSITFHMAQGEMDRRQHFQTIVTFGLLAVLLSAASILILRILWADGVWRNVLQSYFWPLLLLTSTSILTAYGLGVLRGLRLFKESNVYNALTGVAFLALLLALWLIGSRINVGLALLAKLGGALFIVGLIVARLKKATFRFAPKFDTAIAGGLLTYGLGYFGYSVFQNLNYRFDVILVSSLTDAASTGWYTTATGLSEILWFLPNAIGTVLLPTIAGSRCESSDLLTAKVCRTSVALMALGILALCAGSRLIVATLYGTDFLPAAFVIYSLAIGIFANGLFTVLGTYLASRRMFGTLMATTGCGLAVNVALNLWWIPLWGIVGAGLASSVSYSVAALLTAREFTKLTGLGWREILLMKADERRAFWKLILKRLGHRLS